MSTPPWTDVRQHTPDPRHRRRVAPSHLRIAQLGSVSTAHGHSRAQLRPELGEPPSETAIIRGSHTAHRLFRSTGPPQRVMTLRPKRFRMIQGDPPSPDTQRYGGKRPRGSSRRATTLCERRHHHSERYTTIQSPAMQPGDSHHTTEQACNTHVSIPPCVTCERQRRTGNASADTSVAHPIG